MHGPIALQAHIQYLRINSTSFIILLVTSQKSPHQSSLGRAPPSRVVGPTFYEIYEPEPHFAQLIY